MAFWPVRVGCPKCVLSELLDELLSCLLCWAVVGKRKPWCCARTAQHGKKKALMLCEHYLAIGKTSGCYQQCFSLEIHNTAPCGPPWRKLAPSQPEPAVQSGGIGTVRGFQCSRWDVTGALVGSSGKVALECVKSAERADPESLKLWCL